MSKVYVKFTGRFSDLQAAGWRFHKAFARNYRVYDKHPDGDKYGQSLTIWQHLGGYLEIADFFDFSVLFVDAIKKGEHKDWTGPDVNGVFAPRFFINKKENSLMSLKWADRNAPDRFLYEEDDITKERIQEYRDTWKEAYIDRTVIAELENLLKLGWIDVVEDNRDKLRR